MRRILSSPIAVGAIIMMAVPIQARAEEISTEAVFEEMGEQIEHVKEWVMDRFAEFGGEREEPTPLGRTVRLQFAIEGMGQSFSVVTATSAFSVSGNRSEFGSEEDSGHKATEIILNAGGMLTLDEEAETLLLQCGGSFMVTSNHEEEGKETSSEVLMDFNASTILRYGEKKTLASHNDLELTVTATVEP